MQGTQPARSFSGRRPLLRCMNIKYALRDRQSEVEYTNILLLGLVAKECCCVFRVGFAHADEKSEYTDIPVPPTLCTTGGKLLPIDNPGAKILKRQ